MTGQLLREIVSVANIYASAADLIPPINTYDVRRRCGLLSPEAFAAQRAAIPFEEFPRSQPRPEPGRLFRCSKCSGKRARAHHHLCPKRGACHYRRAEQDRRRAAFIAWRGERQSGRTTAMLCRAVAALARGKAVGIATHSAGYTRELVERAKRMAVQCGLSYFVILEIKAGDLAADGRLLGHRDVAVYRDHYRPGADQ